MGIPQPMYEDVKIGDRLFRVKQFEAKDGCYVIYKIAGILAKSFKKIDTENFDLSALSEAIFSLTEEEFKFIQDACLKVSFEVLPGREAPMLSDEGFCESNSPDLDMHNTALIMELTLKALVFNLKGFIKGSNLTSILDKVASFKLN